MLMHCYTSGAELAKIAAELGAWFSVSGIATFKAAEDVRAVIRAMPADRIIVETDCPYLAPIPHRGSATSRPMSGWCWKSWPRSGAGAPTRPTASRPRRFSACLIAYRGPNEFRGRHYGKRIVGRRATRRRRLGRLRSGRAEEPSDTLFDAGPPDRAGRGDPCADRHLAGPARTDAGQRNDPRRCGALHPRPCGPDARDRRSSHLAARARKQILA